MLKGLLIAIVFFSILPIQGQSLDSLKRVAERLRDVEKAEYFIEIGNGYNRLARYDSSQKYFELILSIIDNEDHYQLLGKAHNGLGIAHYKRTNYKEAIINYRLGLDYFIKTKNDTSIAQAQTNLGLAFKGLDIYDKALEYLEESANTLEILKDTLALSSAYSAMGNIHREVGTMDYSYERLTQSLKLRQEFEYPVGIAKSLHNLGSWYLQNGDLIKAKEIFTKALAAKRKLKNRSLLASSLTRLGEVYFLLDSIERAKIYFQESLSIRKEFRNAAGISSASNQLARLHISQNNLNVAKAFLDTSYRYAIKGEFLQEQATVLSLKKMLLEKQGNYREAILVSNELISVNDSLLNEQKSKFLMESEIKYNVHKKDLELAEKEIQLDVVNNRSEKLFIMAVALALAVLIIVLILLASQKLSKERKVAKDRIERLLSELNHRTKNHLQAQSGLIKRQLIKLKDSPAKDVIKDIDNQIRAINLIHQSLYISTEESPESINLTSYVENIVENLLISFNMTRNQIDLVMELDKIDIDIHKALPIGLILNESVTNSFKYAFNNSLPEQKQLIIELKQLEKESISLLIKDNGPGFDIHNFQTKPGGLRIMKDLSGDLPGTLKISGDNGTVINLLFKK